MECLIPTCLKPPVAKGLCQGHYTADYGKKLRARRRQEIHALKTRGCLQCGRYTDEPKRLQFHHRDPASKVFVIGESGHYSDRALQAEIAKCDILCHDCHRKRHPATQQEVARARRCLEINAPELLVCTS